jgi:flagellar biosynthesis protein FlhA
MLLLLVLLCKKSYEISMLPTIQLLLTCFNLAICLSITRQILSKGEDFDDKLIRFISSIFADGSKTIWLSIGFSIFIVLYAVHILVFIKGCTRVSGVAASFVLDSMQVKLMAVEAELNSDSIDEKEAKAKKANIFYKSDFYGSLEGASKFLAGNEKVKIFILLVIIIGGSIIDVLRGTSLIKAITTHISIAIGAGVFFIIPSQIQAISMGVIATRANID